MWVTNLRGDSCSVLHLERLPDLNSVYWCHTREYRCGRIINGVTCLFTHAGQSCVAGHWARWFIWRLHPDGDHQRGGCLARLPAGFQSPAVRREGRTAAAACCWRGGLTAGFELGAYKASPGSHIGLVFEAGRPAAACCRCGTSSSLRYAGHAVSLLQLGPRVELGPVGMLQQHVALLQ